MIKRNIKKILFFLKVLKYDNVKVYYSSNVGWKTQFEGANVIYENCYFSGSIGYGSYIQHNCELEANIGRFTSIAPYTRSNRGIHPYTYPFATTCPMFFSLQKITGKTFADRCMFNEDRDTLIIGNDVWICENVFLVGGINVGDGAVVLPGAVVTKDVPPYSIVGGVPAKVIKYRYDEDTIEFLINFKWWKRDTEWLKMHWELLCDINKLKEYSKEEACENNNLRQ